jgi:hypothetical protein
MIAYNPLAIENHMAIGWCEPRREATYDDGPIRCDGCHEDFPREERRMVGCRDYCMTCYPACDGCGKRHPRADLVDFGGELYGPKCMADIRDEAEEMAREAAEVVEEFKG